MKQLFTSIFFMLSPVAFFLPADAQSAIDFAGTNSYITFGNNATLRGATFTVECWFKRTGTGVTTTTGTGGLANAIPLVTKGRGESDGSNVDMNYFFGINTSGNVLAADFEEGASGSSPGLNHPISGTTAITNNVWYHAAVTYDGTTWKLYLNGVLDGTLTVSQPPQHLSVQHASIGSALTSTGASAGYFRGTIDEVRVWNYARTQAEIRSAINSRITSPQSGLLGRWGLDEGSGTAVRDTSGNNINGTITGSGHSWVTNGAPFNMTFNSPPVVTISSPAANEKCLKDSVNLGFTVSDPENDTLTVKIYARPKVTAPPDFTFIALPDVQFYTEQTNGGNNSYFKAQTNWIVSKKDSLNIVHVCQLGDCVQNGDNNGNDIEWRRADTSMKVIEDTAATHLPYGLPYTMNVGNHDQSPGGNPKGATTFFNQYFGVSRFSGRSYWGGNYGSDADNSYQLFSASGIDFIAISFEYDPAADTNVLKWANNLLQTYSNRKAIIISHWLINSDASFSAQGSAIYNALKANPNLFLMLCGHVNPNGEARRSDTYNGFTVHTLLSDYQDRTNGGNGWLRIMKLSPENNTISVTTYSPTLKQFETDANSQFSLTGVKLFPGAAYQLLGSQVITGGSATINYSWDSLTRDTTYEWYAEVSDGKAVVSSSIRRFSTYQPEADLGADITQCGGEVNLDAGSPGKVYLWSTGATARTIKVSSSDEYSVSVINPAGSCQAYDTVKVTVNPLPHVNLGKDTAVCGDSLQLDAGNPGALYVWSTSSAGRFIQAKQTGNYSVTVTDSLGCSGADTVSLTINPLPQVSFSGLDTTYYETDPAAPLTGSPAGGIFTGPGIKNSSFNPAEAGAGGPYMITYTYTDTKGCTASSSRYVSVYGVTGLNALLKDARVSVYPNPADKHVTVDLDLTSAKEVAIELVDATGKIMVVQTARIMPAGKHNIEISRNALGLPAGFYLLKIKAGSSQGTVRVIFQ